MYFDIVGVLLLGVELKIVDSGEVFYCLFGVFVEYFNNFDSMVLIKDKDGWVVIGDVGFVEEKIGYLWIIDCVKDVGKMVNGLLFVFKYVENKMKFFFDVFEVVVFGDGWDCCCVFLNIDFNVVGNWVECNNIVYLFY